VQRVCVFCGASSGRRAAYLDAARAFGEEVARRDLGLVFGGGRVGMMGGVADAALSAGGATVCLDFLLL
jgi:predicted Rossmann-fold nucleotide-binding protein